jgi:flagellar biosynthesis protein FlhB
MAGQSSEEKTRQPTAKRLRDARKKGQAAKSQDLAASVSLLVGLAVAMLLATWFALELAQLFQAVMLTIPRASQTNLFALILESMWTAGLPSLAVAAVTAALGTGLLWLQQGSLWSVDPMLPKLERMNPVEGFKRVFSMRTLVQLLQMLIKLTVIGLGVAIVFARVMPDALRLVHGELGAALALAERTLLLLLLGCGLAFMLLGLADLAFQRWQFLKDQRMTMTELKREWREIQMKPEVKQEMRRAAQEPGMQAALKQLRYAQVILLHSDGRTVALSEASFGDQPYFYIIQRFGPGAQERVTQAARSHGKRLSKDDRLLDLIFGGFAPYESIKAPALVARLRARMRPG